MAKSNISFNGLDDLMTDLDNISKNVSNNSKEVHLLIDYELIKKNISNVNCIYKTVFDDSSSKCDIENFFANAYTDILAANLLSSNSDAVKIFNDKFSPYAKIE